MFEKRSFRNLYYVDSDFTDTFKVQTSNYRMCCMMTLLNHLLKDLSFETPVYLKKNMRILCFGYDLEFRVSGTFLSNLSEVTSNEINMEKGILQSVQIH